jgi:hypothetical protein
MGMFSPSGTKTSGSVLVQQTGQSIQSKTAVALAKDATIATGIAASIFGVYSFGQLFKEYIAKLPKAADKLLDVTGDIPEKQDIEDKNIMPEITGIIPEITVVTEKKNNEERKEAGIMDYAGILIICSLIFIGFKYV